MPRSNASSATGTSKGAPIINHTADPTEKRDRKADTSARARPAAVLTSSELAYTREDGKAHFAEHDLIEVD